MSAEHHFRSLLTFTHLTAPSKSTFEGMSTECGCKTDRIFKRKRNLIIFCNSISQEGFQSMQEQEQCRRWERQELGIHIAASEKILFGTSATTAVGKSHFVCFTVFLGFGDIDVVVAFIIASELRGSEVDCGHGLCDQAGAARPAPRRREQRVFCWWRLQGGYSVMSRVSRQ